MSDDTPYLADIRKLLIEVVDELRESNGKKARTLMEWKEKLGLFRYGMYSNCMGDVFKTSYFCRVSSKDSILLKFNLQTIS